MKKFLSIFISLITGLTALSIQASEPSAHYVMVVDVGSTHSTLYVYQYQLDPQNKTADSIKTIYEKEVKPGLNSIRIKPETIDNYLQPLSNTIT